MTSEGRQVERRDREKGNETRSEMTNWIEMMLKNEPHFMNFVYDFWFTAEQRESERAGASCILSLGIVSGRMEEGKKA